jgi:hypothetical protein
MEATDFCDYSVDSVPQYIRALNFYEILKSKENEGIKKTSNFFGTRNCVTWWRFGFRANIASMFRIKY